MAIESRNDKRIKRHERVRKTVFGTPEKPRMAVYRSSKNISVQIIDDVNHKTLVAASSLDKEFEGYGGNKEAAKKVGHISTEHISALGCRHYNTLMSEGMSFCYKKL